MIIPSPNGNSSLYEEKLGRDLALSPTSSFKLLNVFPETKIESNSRPNFSVSPISRILQRRLQYLIKEAGASANVLNLHKRAGKEVVIRFGLSKGLQTRNAISDESYPELDDIQMDWKNPKDSNTQKFISVLVGFSQLAHKYKKGDTISPEDLEAMIEAFAEDFADGKFTVGNAANPASIPVVTTSDLAQIQFIDNAEIITSSSNTGGGTTGGETTPGGGGTTPVPTSNITISAPPAGHYNIYNHSGCDHTLYFGWKRPNNFFSYLYLSHRNLEHYGTD